MTCGTVIKMKTKQMFNVRRQNNVGISYWRSGGDGLTRTDVSHQVVDSPLHQFKADVI